MCCACEADSTIGTSRVCAPTSRYCFSSVASAEAVRTTACAGYGARACSCARTLRGSLGACSASIASQSNPVLASSSVAYASASPSHRPICGRCARSASLNVFRGSCMTGVPSDEVDRDASEAAKICVQDVAALHIGGPREGPAEHHVPGIELFAVRGDLVGQPGDAGGGVVQHPGSEPGFLDHCVLVEQGADPAQVERIGTHRPAAQDDARVRREIRDGVEHLARG